VVPHFYESEELNLQWSSITPGITRRARNAATAKFTMRGALNRGRVHAVVMPRVSIQISTY
jgi:hypothetical protein